MKPEPSEEEIDRAVIFLRHIERHLASWKGVHHVMCKVCNKTLDEIYEEERA